MPTVKWVNTHCVCCAISLVPSSAFTCSQVRSNFWINLFLANCFTYKNVDWTGWISLGNDPPRDMGKLESEVAKTLSDIFITATAGYDRRTVWTWETICLVTLDLLSRVSRLVSCLVSRLVWRSQTLSLLAIWDYSLATIRTTNTLACQMFRVWGRVDK